MQRYAAQLREWLRRLYGFNPSEKLNHCVSSSPSLVSGKAKSSATGARPEDRQRQPEPEADAGADCTELHFRLNGAGVGEDHAAKVVPDEREPDSAEPVREKSPPIGSSVQPAARADAAEPEAAHRPDAAGVETLEERRAAPDPAGVGAQGQDGLAIEQVFVDRGVPVEAAGEFLERRIRRRTRRTTPSRRPWSCPRTGSARGWSCRGGAGERWRWSACCGPSARGSPGRRIGSPPMKMSSSSMSWMSHVFAAQGEARCE